MGRKEFTDKFAGIPCFQCIEVCAPIPVKNPQPGYNRNDQAEKVMRDTVEDSTQGLVDGSQREAVRDQLDRMLASPYFSHSKRFPNFLRFVVDQTLSGTADNIKERTLGIEIFGRDADYDTASDPIVRVTAAEIRKRTAQYYQDPEHRQELRITLPSGSYVPQFQRPSNGTEQTGQIAETRSSQVETRTSPVMERAAAPNGGRRHWLVAAAIATVLFATLAGGFLFWQQMQRGAFEAFWGPVLNSREPVLLCIADQLEYSVIALRDASAPERQVELKDNLTAVVIDDLNATVKVAGILQSHARQYSLKGEGATNLAELRRGPTVFVGAFDNAWTLRLTNPLRYHFANDPNMNHLWIVDSTAPGQSRWVIDRGVQMATNNYRDYAIVARFTDVNTGNLAVILAGVGRGGTRVAGEFLTDPSDLAELQRLAKAAGDKKNMEVVLSTQIIDGEPGSPKIEATYFW